MAQEPANYHKTLLRLVDQLTYPFSGQEISVPRMSPNVLKCAYERPPFSHAHYN